MLFWPVDIVLIAYYAIKYIALTKVLAHYPCQFKHRYLWFTENIQQLGVGVDGALVGSVLQVVGFDVVPQFFDDLGAQDLFAAYHRSQCVAGL